MSSLLQEGDIGREKSKVMVLDGGFSSQLSCYVGDRVDGDPLWTARFLQTNPKEILRAHLDFLKAGADVILTNTYQASVGGFVKYLYISPEEAYKLIGYAVELAKEARATYLKEKGESIQSGPIPMIVGSVGPYGAHLHDGSEYDGSYADKISKETMIEWHRPRIQALVEAGVDMLALETIPCEKEADALLELLKEYPKTKAWLSFSCKDDSSLAHGENFQAVIKKCWESNAEQLVAVGANCCSPHLIENLLKEVNTNRESPIPFVVYPNSGEKYNRDLGWIDRDKCESLDKFIDTWLNLGVKYVGGCCRTYADDIIKIRKAVDNWSYHESDAKITELQR